MTKRAIPAVVCLAAVTLFVLFSVYVWPTRYRTVDVHIIRPTTDWVAARQDRFSGEVQWLKIGQGEFRSDY